uniref:tetratricopeptide repeat protein n=1 Tax=Vibrio cholerae TaxID=666 RepID=UPI003D2FC071
LTQGQLNQSEQAIQTYNHLIAYVGDDQTPALRERLVKAMLNKGVTQGQLNQSEQAIQTYNHLIANVVDNQTLHHISAYVGDDKTPALREQVAMAMLYKGVTQSQLNQSEQEIQTYND